MSTRYAGYRSGGNSGDVDSHRTQARLRQLRAELDTLEITRGVSLRMPDCKTMIFRLRRAIAVAITSARLKLDAAQRTHGSPRACPDPAW